MHFYVKNMEYELNDQVIKLDEPSSYHVPRIRKQKKILNREFISNKLYAIFGYSFLIYKIRRLN